MQEDSIATALRGRALLAEPALNKGTAFTDAERHNLGLVGLLPDAVETIEQQVQRCGHEFDRLANDLEKHVYLRALQDHNEVLFFRFVRDRLEDTLPVIYTPTVGLATQMFSRIYRRSQGLFLSYRNRETMREQFASITEDIRVVVVTDGERILGLGDQGVGGIGIPNGKLSLYSAFGGINPECTLPIMLDVGTNNAERLANPNYLGWRNERVTGHDYDDFVELFVTELLHRFPSVLLQWEDFASTNAPDLLARYRDRLVSFNDDIQGTAAVAMAALWSALRVSGQQLDDLRLMIVGAGSAGTGIADMVVDVLRAAGADDPLAQVLLVDRDGPLHTSRTDLAPYQLALSRPVEDLAWLGGAERLADHARGFGANAVIGVSGASGIFDQELIAAVAANADRPIVMPLSNPTSKAEATPEDVLAWSNGTALVATGSPFDPVMVNGESMAISQANNAYVFPGVGLAVLAVEATRVSDAMLLTAAQAVTDPDEIGDGSNGLLPPLDALVLVSDRIARAVARTARDEGLTEPMDDAEIDHRLAATAWVPEYRPVTAEVSA